MVCLGPVRALAGGPQLGGKRAFRIQDAADTGEGPGATHGIPPRAEKMIHSSFIQFNPGQLF